MPRGFPGRSKASCHPERILAGDGLCKSCWKKRWRKLDPELTKRKNRRWRLSSSYGMSEKEYDKKLLEQNGVCAICKLPPLPNLSLAIDHDHKTNKNRGLIHATCNSGLGLLKDSPTVLRNAAEYLERYS